MNHYEINFILNPEQEESKKGIEAINNFVKENNGNINDVNEIGIRKLHYDIKKFGKGYFYRLNVNLPPTCMGELDKLVRITDPIIKYMPINLKKK